MLEASWVEVCRLNRRGSFALWERETVLRLVLDVNRNQVGHPYKTFNRLSAV